MADTARDFCARLYERAVDCFRCFQNQEEYMREKYESLALVQLKELAKVRGLKGTSSMKKADLVEAMLAEDERVRQRILRMPSRPRNRARPERRLW